MSKEFNWNKKKCYPQRPRTLFCPIDDKLTKECKPKKCKVEAGECPKNY